MNDLAHDGERRTEPEVTGGRLGPIPITRRSLLRRLGALGLAVPMGTALLAACTPAAPAASTPPPLAAPTAAPKPPSAPSVPTGSPAVSAIPSPAVAPVASAVASPAATGPRATSSKPRAIIGLVQEPTALDPTADATASIATCLRDNLYEGVVRLDASGKVVGGLAKSWDVSPDGTSVTFHLQTGVKWHDGSPFTAQDVKFSWDRAADANSKPPNPHKDYWAPVSSITVVDDATVRVSLKSYSDAWLFHMGQGSACIVSSKGQPTNTTNPVGTGPFKFGQWNRGSSLTLVRNDDYWGAKAILQGVEFRFVSDADAMNNALKAGDIDCIGQVGGPEQLSSFQQDPKFTILKGPGAGKVMVSINETSGPLADPKVRQGLYAAIDRKAWVDGIQAGYGVPIGSHACPNEGEPYYLDLTSVNPYDPQKAKQLLQAAGQANLKLRLAQISAFPYAVRGTDILNSQLQAVGVTLDVQPMEFPRWLQQVFNGGDYDLTIINHVEERDIGNYANAKYYWHYGNSQVADWLHQADAEPDQVKRNNLYGQVQKQLAADAANLWVYSPNILAASKSSFKNFQVQGISPSLYLADAYFS